MKKNRARSLGKKDSIASCAFRPSRRGASPIFTLSDTSNSSSERAYFVMDLAIRVTWIVPLAP